MITAQYPLSALQQGMIYHHLLDRGAGVDIEQMVISLPEALDVAAIRAAFTQMVARHDGLRASYRWEGLDEPISEVHDRVDMPIREEDWSDAAPSAQEAHVIAVLEEERRVAFDLRQPGVQKVVILRFGPSDWRVIWTFHHLVFDGSTM